MKGLLRNVFAAAFLVAGAARAGNHPELDWFTVETEHFVVHYHAGAEGTARIAAEIAEAIYPRITGLYDFEPENRTHFILADYEDYANGSAYFFDGKLEIWATNLEFDLRGTTQWLWNVITHEFTHMVNIQASQRTPKNVPAVYLQYFGYEDERRTDVLTGYPNTLVSYPLSSVLVPAWFAEGTAQYMAPDTHHDYWDAHRDMILRTAALDGELLSYDEMSLFKGSLASEKVYDHGFSLVRYIAREHGPEALEKIIIELKKRTRFSAEGAFRKVTGRSGRELYDAWRAEIEAQAREQIARIEPTRREGRKVAPAGSYNVRPSWSPDGKRLAWLSNTGGAYHRTSLVVRSMDPADSTGAELEVLVAGVSGGFDWSPDGKSVYYGKRETKDRYGSIFFDLFRYDFETKKSTRLTRGARLRDPVVSPDGTRLAAVRNTDGTNDLVLVDLPAEEERAVITPITASPFGRQIYSPVWLDGERLLVDLFDGGGELRPEETRDLAIVRAVPHEEPVKLLAGPSDERMPCLSHDGAVLYACDLPASGFAKYDLYRLDVDSGERRRLSNVVGGAFYPSESPDGTLLAYSGMTSEGYEIFVLPLAETLDEPVVDAPSIEREPSTVRLATIDWSPKRYTGQFSRFLLSPRVLVDEGRLKVGVYGNTADVLDKQSIFGGFAIGHRTDLDFFALYENRFFWPTLFAEGFWVRKHRDDLFYAKLEGQNRRWDLDLRYDAIEFDVGAKLQGGNEYDPYAYSEAALRFRYSKNHINLVVSRLTPSDDLVDDGIVVLPKDGWDYHRGRDIVLSVQRRSNERRLDVEINPIGTEYDLSYTYSNNDLFNSENQDVNEAGILSNPFDNHVFHQVTGSYTRRTALPGWDHALETKLSGGWMSNNLSEDTDRLDDFFWFRLGSRPGMRGYTYYTLEGRAYTMGRVAYRFPIWKSIDRRFLQLLFERLYGGVFYEAALVWENPVWSQIKRQKLGRDVIRDVGAELRLDLVNFYTFPARLHLEAAYPLDRVPIPNALTDDGSEQSDEPILTDEDWRFYFGVLFGY